MKKADIINTTIKTLNENYPFQFFYKAFEFSDGLLSINFNKINEEFKILWKQDVKAYMFEEIESLKTDYDQIVVIADNITNKLKYQLRKSKISYIINESNLYIEVGSIFIFIDQKKKNTTPKVTGNRAFSKTGLKLVFQFLCDPTLINKTHRQISTFTGVSLGTIPQVINALKSDGFLISKSKKEHVWNDRERLLKRWIEGYDTTLKPHLVIGKYNSKININDLIFENNNTLWGGEKAGEMITDYLRPEQLLLYTNASKMELIKEYKFQPKQEGEIEVLQMFWNPSLNKKTVPYILVYADLMIEGGKRNIETAKMIYDEYIQSIL